MKRNNEYHKIAEYVKKYIIIVVPFLISSYFVLFAFNYNIHEVALEQLWRPLIFAFVVALIPTLIALLCWRDSNKAVFFSGIFVILFWNYDVISGFFRDLEFVFLTDRRILPLLILVNIYACVLLFDFLEKKDITIKGLNKFACFIALVLIAFNVVQIISAEMSIGRTVGSNVIFPLVQAESLQVPRDDLPNIYFFIFDEAADLDDVETLFGFDTSDFRMFLDEKNFHIVEDSRTMYISTVLALASIFNLDYITPFISHQDLIAQGGVLPELRDPATLEAINNSRMVELLRSHGYRTIAYNSFPDLFTSFDNFDEVRLPLVSEGMVLTFFDSFLLDRTMLNPFQFVFHMGNVLLHPYQNTYNQLVYTLNNVSNFVPEKNQPTFLFAYFPFPHVPFVFEIDGSFRLYNYYYWRNYVDSYMYMTLRLEEIITNILDNDENAIIIIQSDHGARGHAGGFPGIDIPYIYMFRVLNLIRFPEYYEYPSMRLSPLNTIKYVFNTVLGEEFDILEEGFYD